MRPSRWGGVGAIAVSLALVAAGTTATGAPPDEFARGKEWVAMGTAYGAAGAEQQGVSIVWSGALAAAFRFTIDEAGAVAGEWSFGGYGTQEVATQGVEAVGDLDYDGGGPLSGDENTIVANGTATTTGVVEPIGLAVDNTSQLPALPIDVEVYCGEMWGTFELTVQEAFEDAGFSGPAGLSTFDGTFMGSVRYEGFSDEAIEELNEHGLSMELLNSWSGDYSLAERIEFEVVTVEAHFFAAISALQRLEDTYPNWSGPDAYAVVDQLHVLLNVIRNLSDCTRGVIGEDQIERWTDSIHGVLNRLIAKLVDLELYPGRPPRPTGFAGGPALSSAPVESPDPAQATLAYQQLVDFAMRSAVIGAGARDPAAAAESERALIDAGSRLLTDLVAVGGTDDDRRRILVTGALMGWQFDVDGAAVDAGAALAEVGLTS